MFSKIPPTYYFIGISVLLIVGLFGYRFYSENQPGQYDEFAQCIADSGATFWGAFWCPHCAEQKKLFGSSVQYLPYHECSLPNGQGQNEDCNAAGIKGYPTWDFANGERIARVLTLQELADQTGCTLPQ
jgi:hypothetical protein